MKLKSFIGKDGQLSVFGVTLSHRYGVTPIFDDPEAAYVAVVKAQTEMFATRKALIAKLDKASNEAITVAYAVEMDNLAAQVMATKGLKEFNALVKHINLLYPDLK